MIILGSTPLPLLSVMRTTIPDAPWAKIPAPRSLKEELPAEESVSDRESSRAMVKLRSIKSSVAMLSSSVGCC